MSDIAILIPTYGRFTRLESVAKNIHDTTTRSHTIYFLCEKTDLQTIRELRRVNEKFILCDGNTYVSAINRGYRETTEPYLLLGSDDIEFTKGWDEKMIWEFMDEKIGVVGAMDEWEITKTGKHGSHLMISRQYIQKHSGVKDEADVVYSSQYIHV
jgi:hypothetical protein